MLKISQCGFDSVSIVTELAGEIHGDNIKGDINHDIFRYSVMKYVSVSESVTQYFPQDQRMMLQNGTRIKDLLKRQERISGF